MITFFKLTKDGQIENRPVTEYLAIVRESGEGTCRIGTPLMLR